MRAEQVAQGATTASGMASVLGSWQICHAVCLGIIATLGAIGISVTFMPLAFLTSITVPMWIIAAVLLAATAGLFVWRHCISTGLLMLNTGIVIAGTPFLAAIQPVFWTVGGATAATGAALMIRDRKRCCT